MRARGLLFLFVTLSTACGDKEEDAENSDSDGSSTVGGTGGTGGTDVACEADADCPDGTICEPDVCIDGDRNNSVDEAEGLLFDESVTGILNPAGDVDYYTFESTGSELVRVATVLEDDVVEFGGDTVLVVRDPTDRVVAVVDNYPTESRVTGADSVVYAWLAEPGTYTVSVHDDGDYFADPDDPADGFRSYVYSLSVSEWSRGTSESDSAESPSVDIEIESDRSWSSTGVVIEEPEDVDHLSVTVDASLSGYHLVLDANRDLTGSDLVPRFQLYNADDELILSKSDVGPQGKALVPFAPSGSYRLEIDDAEGQGSANHWTFAHLIVVPDDFDNSTFEREAGTHDSRESAQALTQTESTTSSGNSYTFANLYGTLDDPEGADWFALEAGYGTNYLGLCLSAGVYGSLASVSAELYDSEGALLETVTTATDAPALADLYLSNTTAEDGTIYLRIVPDEGVGGRDGDWYMLTAYVASFEASAYGCPDG